MRSLLLVLFVVVVTSSCRDKIICAAFQSTYILDDSTRMAYYSYVWNLDKTTRDQYISSLGQSTATTDISASDSLTVDSVSAGGTSNRWEVYYTHAGEYKLSPNDVRRSSFGIIKYEPMWLKNYKLRTAPKENILAPVPETPYRGEYEDIGDFVASDFAEDSVMEDSLSALVSVDSLTLDSVRSVTPVAEETPSVPAGPTYLYGYDPDDDFNVEQEYYNKYFGKMLVYSPPKKQVEQPVTKTDSTEIDLAQEIPSDSSGFVEPAPQVPAVDSTRVEEKKGLFKNRKKKEDGTPGSNDDENNQEGIERKDDN